MPRRRSSDVAGASWGAAGAGPSEAGPAARAGQGQGWDRSRQGPGQGQMQGLVQDGAFSGGQAFKGRVWCRGRGRDHGTPSAGLARAVGVATSGSCSNLFSQS